MNTANFLAALTGYTCWALFLIVVALVIYARVRDRQDADLDVPDWLSQANADSDLDEEWKRAPWGEPGA